MPGEKIQRHVLIATHGQKLHRKIRWTEFSVDKMTARAKRRTADLHIRKLLRDGSCRRAVELQVVVVRAAPHDRTILGFVPDFPITDVVMMSVRPAFVVMPDDAEADRCPFFHVRRRVGISFHARVLDAFAQPVDRLRAGLADGLDVFVGERKIIAPRQRRIGVRVWKDRMVIDHIRIGPAAVVQSGERNAQFLLLLDEIKNSTRCQRPLVDAVERTDGTDVNGEIRAKNRLVGVQ